MGKYFGTDGFRGEAGITLTADHAYKVGRFLGWYYNALRERNGNNEPARIVIGKDTRRSSYMFEYSLVAGLTASGADAYLLHVTTTPSAAYIARVDDFDCGIMISASHNPYYDNGIKLIDCYGEKMSEEILLLVEDYIDGKLHVFDKDWPELRPNRGGFGGGRQTAELFGKKCSLYPKPEPAWHPYRNPLGYCRNESPVLQLSHETAWAGLVQRRNGVHGLGTDRPEE